MVFLLVFCFSFIFICKSFSFKSPSRMKSERKLFREELVSFPVSWFHKRLFIGSYQLSNKMSLNKKKNLVFRQPENCMEGAQICLLDLPELALDSILERLSPAGLCSMAGVCSSLREKCISDHLWVKHLNTKWGRLISDVAFVEWHISSMKSLTLVHQNNRKGLLNSLTTVWPFSWIKPRFEITKTKPTTSLPVDSIMALYLSLERGQFWFPAQVYNRENGHAGFLLSCYDAQISYDSKKDTFKARYCPYGRRIIEDNIEWDRVRAPPVDTPAHTLHISDCLNDLKPGDHIEIQWRKKKEFPYGWWYAVVGHMESCDGNELHCHCQFSDMLVLEFKQYPPSSKWRKTIINRKEHSEEGNEANGFYGGIRKLHKEEEISTWQRFWLNDVFE